MISEQHNTENVGHTFEFKTRYPIEHSVILDNITCMNDSFDYEHLYKVFYVINSNKGRIRYVPHKDINILDEISNNTNNGIYETLEVEDYWYNFLHRN